MNGDVKTTFIQMALAEYNTRVIAGIKAMAGRLKVGVTNDAVNSLAYQTMVLCGGAKSTLSFKEYLRFVDMGVSRKHPLGGMEAMRVTLSDKSSHYAQGKDKGRKAKKVYSKVAYGNLTWLENKLLFGYTESTIQGIKDGINNG